LIISFYKSPLKTHESLPLEGDTPYTSKISLTVSHR
jgi:hypothetical protein